MIKSIVVLSIIFGCIFSVGAIEPCKPQAFYRTTVIKPPTYSTDNILVLTSDEVTTSRKACVHFVQISINGNIAWDTLAIHLYLSQGDLAVGRGDNMISIHKRWLLGYSLNNYPGNFNIDTRTSSRIIHGRCSELGADIWLSPEYTRFGSPAEITIAGVMECETVKP